MADFFMVGWMDKQADAFKRKLILFLSLGMNLGLLFYFKYSNFFITNFNEALTVLGWHNIAWTEVVLPIGISFFTFESLTYVIDVYRKVHKPLNNFWDYQLYIIFFPKLVAGPIVRYHEIANQISTENRLVSTDERIQGFWRFCLGLSKKILLANTIAAKADEIFAVPDERLTGGAVWLGMIIYALQIYYDFSGYSDMALGLGRMMGFKLPENFHNPFTANGVTDFWRRWHMTLGNWMRNYIYIPLGGSKVKTVFRLYFNLWVVFLISGFWHGATWNFIFWGAYHGIFIVLEKLFLQKLWDKIGKIPSAILTFLIIALSLVFFRTEDTAEALFWLNKIFHPDLLFPPLIFTTDFTFFFILSVAFAFFTLFKKGESLQHIVFYSDNISDKRLILLGIASVFLYFLNLSVLSGSFFNPFVYFRF
jgi:alginate O-acetyltransferase complex protein AlgI